MFGKFLVLVLTLGLFRLGAEAPAPDPVEETERAWERLYAQQSEWRRAWRAGEMTVELLVRPGQPVATFTTQFQVYLTRRRESRSAWARGMPLQGAVSLRLSGVGPTTELTLEGTQRPGVYRATHQFLRGGTCRARLTVQPTGERRQRFEWTFPVQKEPRYGREGRLYVANSEEQSLSVVDVERKVEVGRLLIGSPIADLALSPDGQRLWVAVGPPPLPEAAAVTAGLAPGGQAETTPPPVPGGVWVFDTRTHQRLAVIPLGPRPWRVCVGPQYAYVTDPEEEIVWVVEAHSFKVLSTMVTGAQPYGIAHAPKSPRVYVTNADFNQEKEPDTVTVIDTEAQLVAKDIPVGDQPVDVAISPDGEKAYVANLGAGTVSVIALGEERVVQTLRVGGAPWRVAVSPDGNQLAVALRSPGEVTLWEVRRLRRLAAVPIGQRLEGLALGSRRSHLAYVTPGPSNVVVLLDLRAGEAFDAIPVGLDPTAIVHLP